MTSENVEISMVVYEASNHSSSGMVVYVLMGLPKISVLAAHLSMLFLIRILDCLLGKRFNKCNMRFQYIAKERDQNIVI
jgi:hypothetical protein